MQAKSAQNRGMNAEMNDNLHKACRVYPGGSKIWETLLENWWRAGEYEKIKDEGEFIVKSNSTTLEQGDDKNLQGALLIVAKTFYRDTDFVAAQKFIEHASKIRHHNDELYTLKRELKNKAEDKVKKLVDEAQARLAKKEYEKAIELLQTASKMPGSKPSEILEMMDRIEKESLLMKSIIAIDELITSEKLEEALEKLESATLQFPGDEQISARLESVSAKVAKINAEQAKANAAIIAEKQRKLELSRQLNFFIKEAQENEQKKNYDIAIISYEKALKLAPQNVDLPKKLEELKELSKEARDRQNAFSIGFTDLEALFTAGNYAESYEKGKSLQNEFPENKKTLAVILAETCINIGKFAEAKENAVEFENDSEHETLHNYILGMVAYSENDKDKTLEYLKKVSAKNSNFRPGINSTIYWIYLYKMQAGIYIVLLIIAFPAVRIGKEALASWKSARIFRKLEKIKETGDYAANLGFLEERFAREDTPNPKQISVMLAEALLRTGNPQRAYEIVSALLKKDNRNPLAKRIAGEACLLIEDTSPTGMDHIQNLLKIDETRKDIITYLARVYIKQQADHKMAQDAILKAISINPTDTEPVIFLADVYIKRQAYSQQSLKIFEKAIKLAPEIPDYYLAIIENYYRLENPQEAEKWREAALAKFPDHEDFSDQPKKAVGKVAIKARATEQPAAAYPDYDNIGTAAPGKFPDYESIGDNQDDEPPALPVSKPAHVNPAIISGPQKTCPHCNAINSLQEYYCTTCGKPFGA